MLIKPVLSIDSVFHPVPWTLPKAMPVYNDCGELLIFALVRWKPEDFRDSLPTEFFHHQLCELDVNNHEEVASFMTEFGPLGNFDSEKLVSGETATEQLIVSSLNFSAHSYMPANVSNDNFDDEDWVHNIFESLKPDLISALANTLSQNQIWSEDSIHGAIEHDALLPYGIGQGIVHFVTPLQFRCEYLDLMAATIVVDELVAHRGRLREDLKKLHNDVRVFHFNVDECSDEELIDESLLWLNRYLRNLPQRIGYVKEDSDEAVFPGGFWGEGHLSEAIALQIQEFVFNAMHDGYYTCARCGRVFAKKQSKSSRTRKPSTGMDAFCCDKCKSAEQSRRYRQSPGYKLKQKNKKSMGRSNR